MTKKEKLQKMERDLPIELFQEREPMSGSLELKFGLKKAPFLLLESNAPIWLEINIKKK